MVDGLRRDDKVCDVRGESLYDGEGVFIRWKEWGGRKRKERKKNLKRMHEAFFVACTFPLWAHRHIGSTYCICAEMGHMLHTTKQLINGQSPFSESNNGRIVWSDTTRSHIGNSLRNDGGDPR